MEMNVWEKAMGWRKRQMVTAQLNNEVYDKIRNDKIRNVQIIAACQESCAKG